MRGAFHGEFFTATCHSCAFHPFTKCHIDTRQLRDPRFLQLEINHPGSLQPHDMVLIPKFEGDSDDGGVVIVVFLQ